MPGITASSIFWEESGKQTYQVEVNMNTEWDFHSNPVILPPEVRKLLWEWLDSAEDQ